MAVKVHSYKLARSFRDFRPQLAYLFRNLLAQPDGSESADFRRCFAITGR